MTMETDPMHEAFIESTLRHWEDLRGYAQKLVADLSDDEMVSQPIPGVVMNHPAWVLCHLAIYAPVVAAMFRGGSFDDPGTHEYGFGSRPLPDAAAYPKKEELVHWFVGGYAAAAAALRAMDPSRLLDETPLERWRPRFPRIVDLPVQFFIKHNATHLGQLSAWRRAGSRPAV